MRRIAVAAVGLVLVSAGGGGPAWAVTPDHPKPGRTIEVWAESTTPPAVVPTLPAGTDVVDVDGGINWGLALLSDGTVVEWGDRAPAEPDSAKAETFTHVAAGTDDVMAVTDTGKLVSWGMHTQVGDLDVPPALADATVTEVDLSMDAAVALTSTGKVYSWGSDYEHQAEAPASLSDQTAVSVSAGYEHSAVLTSAGAVVDWGDLAPTTEAPAPPQGSSYVKVVAAPRWNLALTDTGKVVQWGDTSRVGSVPDAVNAHRVVAVSAGLDQAMALTDDGKVFSWGDDTYASPAVPEDLQGRTVRAIASGYSGQQLVVTDGYFDPATTTVSGTAAVGETLTATASATPTPTTTDYQWLRDGAAIADATSSTYDLTHADVGHAISVRATFHRDRYDDRSVTSAPTGTVPTEPMPGSSDVLTDGRNVVGSTLTATLQQSGVPADCTVSWAWSRDGVAAGTGPQHAVSLADRTHRLTAVATLSSPGYTDRVVAGVASWRVTLPATRFVVRADHLALRRGRSLVVSTKGLAAREHYVVRVAGRAVATGTASRQGAFQRRVTVPRSTPAGVRRVLVTGWQADRWGVRTLRVRR